MDLRTVAEAFDELNQVQYSRYIRMVEPEGDSDEDRAFVSKINYLNSKKLWSMRIDTLKYKFGFASMLNQLKWKG